MAAVTLKALTKRFKDTEVIRGIDLQIADGEFMVFVGPSGCGKTTTLRMIAGLESPTQGDVLIDGVRCNDIHPAERGAAMVFQSYALYPHMTVAENMGFALRMAGVGRQERDTQVHRAAQSLRLDDLLGRYPRELSGGQRQRPSFVSPRSFFSTSLCPISMQPCEWRCVSNCVACTRRYAAR